MIPEIVKSNGTVLCMAGMDDACIGYLVTPDGMVLLYSHAAVIRCLKENNSWDDEEAREWYDLNIAKAYGQRVVVVVHLNPPDDPVAIECIDEIERLRHALELIRDGQKEATNTNIVDYIDAVLNGPAPGMKHPKYRSRENALRQDCWHHVSINHDREGVCAINCEVRPCKGLPCPDFKEQRRPNND